MIIEKKTEVETLLVCVYGTLRKGGGNHRLLKDAAFLGYFQTKPEYTMYTMGCPFISQGGITSIKTEVYRVDSNTFRSLDILEGYPHFYDRMEINTDYGKAWIYFRDDEFSRSYFNATVVESGDYFRGN